MNENKHNHYHKVLAKAETTTRRQQNITPYSQGKGNLVPGNLVPGNLVPGDFVSSDFVSRDFVSRNFVSRDFVSRNFVSRDFVSRDFVSRNLVPRNLVPRDFVPPEISGIKFDPKEHKYYAPDGHELISVTTLLKKHGIGIDYSQVSHPAKEEAKLEAKLQAKLEAKLQRGREIHAEIESFIAMFINNGLCPSTAMKQSSKELSSKLSFKELSSKLENLRPETRLFLKYLEEIRPFNKHHESKLYPEQIVFNDYLAGTIDLFFTRKLSFSGLSPKLSFKKQNKDNSVPGNSVPGNLVPTFIDFKTGKNIDMTYWSWQLNLYEYLFFQSSLYDKDYSIYNAQRYVLHFIDDKLDVIEIPKIPIEEIERLIECDKNGEIYTSIELSDAISSDLIVKMESTYKNVAALEKHLADAKETEKEVRLIIMEEMKRHKLKTVESELLKITYVQTYQKELFDVKKFKKEHPNTAVAYIKKTQVQEGLKITAK